MTLSPTLTLREAGQSLWLDNITRELLTSGTLKRYIDELRITGLTSNPTIFDQAISKSTDYDAAIRQKIAAGKSGEELFFELALEDLTQAADLFRPVHDATDGVDGFVSLEVSPLLAYDTASTLAAGQGAPRARGAAEPLHQDPRHARGPARHRGGHLRGGADQRDAALLARALSGRRRCLHARHRAAHRRRAQSRRALGGLGLHQPLGPRGGGQGARGAARTSSASRSPSAPTTPIATSSTRTARSASLNNGARPQRLLWASTGTKDPKASDVLYVSALASPYTVNTMPEGTLPAFADHGEIGPLLTPDGGDAEEVLARFGRAGVDVLGLAADLQTEGAKAFVTSWNELMAAIAAKSDALKKAR